ncbi:unnamed protein product [Arabis nemorensis]|uniref:Uncharacterized protein n=1 Tax=Arabis nemorensis TaxID=586526 RepID=A0A565BU69_9BRAS|nr:unnamed protein product [Arabis nemorensis]
MSLHNFIRQHNIRDPDFDNIKNVTVQAQHVQNDEEENNDGVRVEEASEAGSYMRIVRDQIAQHMWSDIRRGSHHRH